MEESQKIIIFLLILFFFVQIFGIYLGTKLIAIPELKPETTVEAGGFIFIYILIVTGIILLIIRYVKQALKVIEVFAIFFSTEIFFETLFLGFLQENIGFYLAVILAIAIVLSRIFFLNIWTQNIAILLSIIGVGALLGASLGILPALVLLGLLTIYDVIAVFKTKHMVTLAKEIVKQRLAFTMAIPTKKHVFQLGGGDLVMPLIFTVSVLRENGLLAALLTMGFSMIALIIFFAYLINRPGKAYPALPPVTIGALIGWGISILIL